MLRGVLGGGGAEEGAEGLLGVVGAGWNGVVRGGAVHGYR